MWARGIVVSWRRGFCSSSAEVLRDRPGRYYGYVLTQSERHDLLIRDLCNCRPGSLHVVAQQQTELLEDLAGRYFYGVMVKFNRFFKMYIPEVSLSEEARRIHCPTWYETPPYLAKLEAFLHYNKMRPTPIFPAGDLEALVCAYWRQETYAYVRRVQGSMLSMALSVNLMRHGSWRTFDTDPEFPVKGITFMEHDPRSATKKRYLALFRILFKKEVEDVVAQHQGGCVDPKCTILLQRIGIRGLPPLLKLYVDQSFGHTTKAQEEASKGLELLLKQAS